MPLKQVGKKAKKTECLVGLMNGCNLDQMVGGGRSWLVASRGNNVMWCKNTHRLANVPNLDMQYYHPVPIYRHPSCKKLRYPGEDIVRCCSSERKRGVWTYWVLFDQQS